MVINAPAIDVMDPGAVPGGSTTNAPGESRGWPPVVGPEGLGALVMGPT